MNRLKPYLLILFVVWPAMTVLFAYTFHQQQTDTAAKIEKSKKVTAVVTSIKTWESGPRRGSKTSSYWADYEYSTAYGTRDGDGPITEQTYNQIKSGKKNSIEVYIGSHGSWTADDWDRKAYPPVSWEHWFIGATLGICAAPFVYYLLSFIPFGPSKKSLRARWSS